MLILELDALAIYSGDNTLRRGSHEEQGEASRASLPMRTLLLDLSMLLQRQLDQGDLEPQGDGENEAGTSSVVGFSERNSNIY